MDSLIILQDRVRRLYASRGYTSDLPTLGLGLCEEIGEIAKEINRQNPHYIQTKHHDSDGLQHEIKDALVYLIGICNAAGISLNDIAASICTTD